MYKTKLIYTFVLFFLISFSSFSQSLKETTANKYYASLSYEKCAPMYAELASKEKASTEIVRKTADSYRLLNSPKEAEKWYAKLSTKPDVEASDYYHYAQTLLQNEKYKEADLTMEAFYSMNSANSIGKRFNYVGTEYVTNLKKDSSKFTIKSLDNVNSIESDFSPSYISKTELVFTSAKENHGANNKDFAWDNTTFLDLYTAKIDSSKQTAEKAERFNKTFKTSYHDGPVSFSPDGKMMLLTRSNYFDDKLIKSSDKIVNIQLYYSNKVGDTWSALKPFPYNNKDFSFGHACFAIDGKTIYFVSDMPGTMGSTDIWETIYENDTFSQPKNLGGEVNTEGREMFPFIDDDNLLLFSSDGHLGLGGLDVNMALMGDLPTYIGNIGYPLNTSGDDFGLVYDTKTLKGYFTSNRIGGKGKDDIYAVKFKEPLLGIKVLKGKIVDETSKDSLPFALVKLVDDKGNVIQEIRADDKGVFSAVIPRDANVQTIISRDGYTAATSTIIPYKSIPKEEQQFILSRKEYRIEGLVLDGLTNKPLDGVKISILDAITNRDGFTKLTDAKGDFKLDLHEKLNEEKIKYIIHIQKDGYDSKDITIERTKAELLENPIINLSEKLMVPNNVPAKVEPSPTAKEETIVVNPIFFDLDKSDIRPDAQVELDKLVETLKARKDVKIEITSSTDCRATNSYNMALSQRRSVSTAEYLKAKGISGNRLSLKWTGENNLTVDCPCETTNESGCTEEQHQQNRRATLKVTNLKVENRAKKVDM